MEHNDVLESAWKYALGDMPTDPNELIDELIEAHCRCCDCLVASTDPTRAKARFEQVKVVIASSWPRPIQVTERLPPDREQVMAYFPKNEEWYFDMWDVAQMVDGKWCNWPSNGQFHDHVTHWLPMPPKPDAPATLYGKKVVIDPSINPNPDAKWFAHWPPKPE